MNSLLLTKLSFTLEFTPDAELLRFIGNTIRGALGRSLDGIHNDVYDDVFTVESNESTPNPFVISVPYPGKGEYNAGETLEFYITLFGTVYAYEAEIMDAARYMCNGKLAGTVLVTAQQEYSREWSDANADSIPFCDALTLSFVTPTELISSKQPVYEPDFPVLIDSLFGRISAIIDNYGEGEFIIPYSLITKKPQIVAKYDCEHIYINSNSHPINSFIGNISYFGDVTRYLPYIDLGSQLPLGKKTTRSYGEYTFYI